MTRSVLSVLALALCVGAGLAFAVSGGASPAGDARSIVLGERGHMGPYGKGWGRVKPRTIYNGGVPSGLVRKIRWRGWGSRVARGRGVTSLYRPEGGYYSKPGRIDLKAYNRGVCPGTTRRAYRTLKARVPRRPGGRMGRWFYWSGERSICGTPEVYGRALAPTAAATVRLPVFEQGRGVVLRVRPAYVDAKRNVRPGSISGRDSWSVKWRRWGGSRAVGTATYWWHTRDGSDVRRYASRLELSRVRRCGAHRIYTRIRGVFGTRRPPGMGKTVRLNAYRCPG